MKQGIYESLISGELAQRMQKAEAEGLECVLDKIDNEESAEMLTSYVADVVARRLKDINKDNLDERVSLVNKIVKAINNEDEQADCLKEENDEFLSAVIDPPTAAVLKAAKRDIIRPRSGFRVSTLFTGGNNKVNMLSELVRDIASADHICMIVSFLRMSGVNMIYDELKKFCSKKGHSLRIITTTYCGITEGKAVEKLASLPNTELRISYNTKIEKLHAKSYIFLRDSGFDSAYIGSSNLSKSAQTTGLEWNIRVTNVENPHIIKTALATFNIYWQSPDFEDYRNGGLERFNAEREKNHELAESRDTIDYSKLQQYSILPHQKEILDKLAVVRKNGLNRNLVVAATGTGKTVLCAFDYRNFLNNNKSARLLFVAHRVEILKQAWHTFRSILCDANFGEIWCQRERPQQGLDHLFISVQTANTNIETLRQLGADYYDYIVFDEAHHIEATTYQRLLNFFQPKLLIGLTATPERADGQSLLPDFGGKISAEIRLPQALEERLLTPFQYLCISDSDTLNLDDETIWSGGKYIDSKLAERLSTKQRVQVVVDALRRYLPYETKVKALCFCVNKRHADYMVEELRQYGFCAASLHSDTPMEERKQLNLALRRGEINYLCVVDVFNEGVDIPEVDTVLFLRPTESLTIFLQQLGRGLRLSPGKDVLTVLDFVAQANKSYDFASRFRALLTKPDVNIEKQCHDGFTFLPTGCYIHMEEKAQKYILDNIRGAIFNINRLTRELAGRINTPTLSQFVESIGQDIRLVYRGENSWTSLKRAAGKCQYEDDEFTRIFSKAMGRFLHYNSSRFIVFLQQYVNNDCRCSDAEEEKPWRVILFYALYNAKLQNTPFESISDALAKLSEYPLFVEELKEIIEYISANRETETLPLNATSASLSDMPSGLDLYGCYTREEIFALFGKQTAEKKMQGSAAGVFAFDDNTEAFFVTLNKSDKDFSPSTMYDDYFVSENQFHWQSQSSESHENKGIRYVQQQTNQKRFILFVREEKKDAYGNTCPYYCMGAVDYISSHGNLPMNIDWQLQQPAMPRFLKAM